MLARILATGLILAVGVVRPARADEHTTLIGCARRLERTAAGAARVRARVLARCVAEATVCPGALDAAATPDACLEAAGARCRARLAGLERLAAPARRLDDACTTALGATAVLGDDGLGLANLAPLCPRVDVRRGVAGDGFACQAAAVACSATAAIGVLAPRTAELLGRAGVSFATTPGCLASRLCGNGVLDGDEECDDGPRNADEIPDACRTTCVEPFCGDGTVDDGEDCDDGNQRDGDGCDADCVLEAGACGNHVVDGPDEECDDGNHRDGDGCDADCVLEEGTCGNGIVEGDEECDDGNHAGGDGCDADCVVQIGACGNGVVEGDEECDDGPASSDTLPDRCRTDCSAPACGDDVVDPGRGEVCEPPGTLVCSDACTLRVGVLPLGAPGSGGALASCQQALLANGIVAVSRTRAIVGRCVQQVNRCVLGRTDATDACLARADRRCTDAAARRDRTIAKLTAVATARCRPHGDGGPSLDDLLRDDGGLGLGTAAAACPFAGTTPPTVSDLVGCVMARARCMGERLVAATIPLAYDLLDELPAPPEDRFPCVFDPDDSDGDVDPGDPDDGPGSASGAFVDAG